MEWLLLAAAAVLALFGITHAWTTGVRKRYEADPDAVLDRWFDGREQVIVEQSAATLSAEQILTGANERGYRCMATTQQRYPRSGITQMVFERR